LAAICLQTDPDDVGTGRLVAGQVQLLERQGAGLQQSNATTSDDALLDGGLGRAHGVLDAVLALLQLDLGGRADLDHRDAAGQLGQPLLQLLAVVVGVALLDLGADLVGPPGDLVSVTGTVDDRRLVLGDHDPTGAAQQVERGVLQLEADVLGDHLATGQDRDVAEHGLTAVAEAGRLHRDGLERATDLVDDQRRQRFTLDVLGDDQQRLAALHDLLQDRQQVLDRRDLAVDHEDVGVVEDGLHLLGVSDEVGRDVTLVEAHTLGEFQLQPEGVALLDGDDAFLANLVHRLGDDLADAGVATSGDLGDRGDLLLGLDILGGQSQLLGHGGDSRLDAALQAHRVGARSDVAQAFAHQGLGEHGRGGRTVTGHVIGLGRNFLDERGPGLLPRVLELDLFSNGNAVVGNRRRAPLLFEDDVAALRTERHLHGVGKGVHAPLETAPGVLVERDQLGHLAGSSQSGGFGVVGSTPATDGAHSFERLVEPTGTVVTRDLRVLTRV
jgi:hypothetical protein